MSASRRDANPPAGALQWRAGAWPWCGGGVGLFREISGSHDETRPVYRHIAPPVVHNFRGATKMPSQMATAGSDEAPITCKALPGTKCRTSPIEAASAHGDASLLASCTYQIVVQSGN